MPEPIDHHRLQKDHGFGLYRSDRRSSVLVPTIVGAVVGSILGTFACFGLYAIVGGWGPPAVPVFAGAGVVFGAWVGFVVGLVCATPGGGSDAGPT